MDLWDFFSSKRIIYSLAMKIITLDEGAQDLSPSLTIYLVITIPVLTQLSQQLNMEMR